MEEQFRKILEAIGEDPQREGLVDTPKRAAQAFEFLTQGYSLNVSDIVKNALFESEDKGLVIIKEIEIFSLCEHHLLPFFGSCHIGYIPTGKVLGLSKIARVVDLFARRLQLQERLTQQIAQCIQEVAHAEGVAVTIAAQHMCMMMRGVEKVQAKMVTSSFLGSLESNQALQQQFFAQTILS